MTFHRRALIPNLGVSWEPFPSSPVEASISCTVLVWLAGEGLAVGLITVRYSLLDSASVGGCHASP